MWYSNPISTIVPNMFLMETSKNELPYHFPMHQQAYRVKKKKNLIHFLKIYLNYKFQLSTKICYIIVINNSLHVLPVKVTDQCALPEK